MKTLYVYLIFVLPIFLFIEARAQKQPIDSSISVRQIKIDTKENKLYLNFNIYVNQPEIKSNQSIVLTPILQSSGTSHVFPEVIINGRNRNISYERTVERKSKAESYHAPYIVLKINKKSQAIIPYQGEIPFEGWMENSTLLLLEDIHCCRDMSQNVATRTVAQNIGLIPLLTYIHPQKTLSEDQQDSATFVLFFPENRTTILSGYRQNNENIIKAGSILTDKNFTVTGVHVVGAASPDGPYELNQQLSKERARSLSSFLASHYNIPGKLEKTEGIGEDWNTLLKMTEQSDMQYKQQVIDIIKNTEIPAKREEALMKLRGGEPFRYILMHFYPDLRYASYTIHYKTMPFNTSTGRELIFSTPKALSPDEMLLVAASYPLKSAEYKRIIDVAAQTYPENMAININASSAALNAGNTAEAKQYLQRFEQQPEAWNNLGVISLIDGNNELAREYFQKAVENGDVNATGNMKKLNH